MKASNISTLITVLGFLAPVKPFVLLVGFFIVLDSVFGIWAAYKTGEAITSKKASRIIYKMLVYQTCVLTAFLIDRGVAESIIKIFIDMPLPVTRVAMVVIIINELGSVEEKIVKVKGENAGFIAMSKKAFSFAKKIKSKKDELYE